MPDSSIRIILNSLYLVISSFEKLPIWRLPFAVCHALDSKPRGYSKQKKRRWSYDCYVSDNTKLKLHGGDGGGKAIFSLFEVRRRQKVPFGRSVSTHLAIVGSITSRCLRNWALTGRIKEGTRGTAEIEPRKQPSSLSKQLTTNGKRNCHAAPPNMKK